MQNAKRTVQISSHIGKGCDHCDEWVGAPVAGDGELTTSINHYVEAHGYSLLHVGQETSHGPDGKAWHHTVAILGHDNPPPLKPPVKVEIRPMG